MLPYPKIETLLDRDPDTHKVIEGKWRLPEFDYLQQNEWYFTEKVDGTNIRVNWNGESITLGGRTDNAQIPANLIEHLNKAFPVEMFKAFYPDTNMTLYGEGYGAKIQKGGGNYISDGVSFVLFDIRIGEWWLERGNMGEIADKLGIPSVPVVGTGTLLDALDFAESAFDSTWGEFQAEGIVVRPTVGLLSRGGHRLIGKLKATDFA